MQRRLNVRLLLWTVGCIVACAIGVTALHAHQVRRNAHVVLERGEQALAKQELGQAIGYFEQYLALAPGNIDALEKFALTLDKLARDPADRIRVVLRIEDLLMRDAERDAARERLIHNLVALQRYPDAMVHLRYLQPKRPKDAGLKHLLGQCHAAVGESEAAVAALTQAIALDPQRIAAYLLLAAVYSNSLTEQEEAARVIDNMVAANATNAHAYLARSRFAQQRGERAAATKDIQKAVALAPDDAEVLLAAATWAESQARLDEARKHLSRGLELHAGHVGMIRMLANLELREGRRSAASRILKDGIAKAPDAFELHVLLADLLIDEKQYDEATRLIAAMSAAGLPPTFPDYLRARLAVERQQWTQAIALLEKTRGILGAQTEWSSRVHAMLGACYERTGDAQQRLAAWQRAVESEPGWSTAKYGLGTALFAAGRFDDAVTELDAVSKASDAPPHVWTALARAQLQVVLRRPEPRRDWTAIESTLAKAMQVDAGGLEVTLVRAEMLAARGAFDDARKLLVQAAVNSKNVALWTARADLENRRGNVDAALTVLDQATAIFGDDVELRLARARFHGARGNADDRDALHDLARRLGEFPLDAQVRLLRGLADTWRLLGDADVAAELWHTIAQVQPADVGSRFLLLEAALQRGDVSAARKWLGEIRKQEGEQGALWRWGAIALQIQEARGATAKLSAARAELADLGRRQRDWPRIPLLEARIDEIEGKWDRVIENGIKAVELGERQPRLTRRLVELLLERRLYAQAEQLMALCEEQIPLAPELARHAAVIAAINNNAGRVRQLIGQLYPAPPRDYRDLAWLANLHNRIDEPTKAEALLRQAVQRAEHVVDTWAQLVEHLARTGQHAAAENVIGQMQQKMPKQRLPFAVARCWDAAGHAVRARASYTAALANQPDDFLLLAAAADFYWRADQLESAAALYERLLDPRAGTPLDLQATARRQLALCRIGTGNTSRALAILDENRQAFAEQIADRRLRWFIEGVDPDRRQRSLQQLKESFTRHPSTVEEELLLVRLDEAAEDTTRARERLAQVLAVQESPQWIAWNIRLLLKTESIDEALVWFAKLERWEPSSPRTRELKQLVLKMQGQG